MYSKNFDENIKERANIILKAENNPELQLLLMKKCEEDPLYFFNMFLYTYKPKAVGSEWEPENPNLPFITYPFQDDFIKDIIWCIENSQDNATEKSREMWFSWQMLWIGIWGMLFKKWSGLIGSYKEDYVDKQGSMDSAFERSRYMLDKLPHWMKPDDLIVKFMSISSKKLWCEIGWDSGKNFGTGWRRKWVFMDEFQAWQEDEMAWRKTKDVTNCRIIWGTPEGKFNVYGKIMTNHPDYVWLDIKKFRLHWTLHPLKTQEWYQSQKLKRTKVDIAKELDISYDDSVTGAVYPSFLEKVRIGKVKYDPNLATYTSWDFGRDTNALIFWQKDHTINRLKIFYSISRIDWDIDKFCAFVTGRPTQGFIYTDEELKIIESLSHIKYTNNFWDPYNGDAKTTNAKQSVKDIMKWMWIHLTLKTGTKLEDRITNTDLALNRIDIDECNTRLIESMVQSRYPQVKENSQSTTERTKPIHDASSHFRTCFEYFIDNEPVQIKSNIQTTPRQYVNRLTGQIVKL